MKTATLFGTICLTLACGSYRASPQTPATNSEVQSIRQEMEQLRQDYERRMQALDERLKRVETPPTAAGTNAAPAIPPPTPVPPVPAVTVAAPQTATNAAAARQAAIERDREFARKQFQQDAEQLDRDIAPATNAYYMERVEKVLHLHRRFLLPQHERRRRWCRRHPIALRTCRLGVDRQRLAKRPLHRLPES